MYLCACLYCKHSYVVQTHLVSEQVDAEDLQTLWNKVSSSSLVSDCTIIDLVAQVSRVLKYNMPSSGGFAAGFVLALRS